MSEFGASSSVALLGAIVSGANGDILSWCYWAWKYYNDLIGSADQALVTTTGSLQSTAHVLAEPYPEAVAGTPQHVEVNPATDVLTFSYVPSAAIRASTIVSTPSFDYPHGYCATVTGATVVSRLGAGRLLVPNGGRTHAVTVRVHPGRCR